MSLRSRLLLVIGILCLTYTAAASLVLRSLETELISQVDARLASLPPVEMPQLNRPAGGPQDQQPVEGTENPYSDFYVAIVTSDGIVQPIVMGNLDATDIDFDAVIANATDLAASERSITTTSGINSGDRYRLQVTESGDGQRFLVSIQSLSEVDSTLSQAMRTFITAGVVIAGVVILAGLWVYRLGLMPIARITSAAEAITRGETSRRVDITDDTTEAGKLGQAFNLMLDERDATEQKLRQFIGDASHELRTPLTSIQGYLELYQQGAFREEGQLDDVVRRLSSESGRMKTMVQDLLTLSNLDEQPAIRHEKVDITQIVRDAAMDASAVQPEREIVTNLEAPHYVNGDHARIIQLIGILVTNALAHTPVNSAITLSVTGEDKSAVLRIVDEGPGMGADAVRHAFDRFWRGSESRTRTNPGQASVGAGLGLSIAQSIVRAHGGTIALRSTPEHGSTFTVHLPNWIAPDSSQEVGSPGR